MGYETSPWIQAGASLSDKSARKEYGLSQDEIMEGISNGSLQFRENVMQGNPYFKLIRREVEAYIKNKYGQNHLEKQKLRAELAVITSELRSLKKKTNVAEMRKKELELCLEKYVT